jgi:hypothetical protein
MGIFAETAIVDYRLLFADQGKHPFLLLANKRKFIYMLPFHKENGSSCDFP